MSTVEAPKRLNNWGRDRDKRREATREEREQKAINDPENTFAPKLVAKQPHGLATSTENQATHKRLFDIAEEQRRDLKRQQQEEAHRIRQQEILQCTFQPSLKTRNSVWYREANSYRDSFFASSKQADACSDDVSIATSQSEVRNPVSRNPVTPAASDGPKR